MRAELNEAFDMILRMKPAASAALFGSENYPDVHGSIYLYPFWTGALILVEAAGLPFTDDSCGGRIFGFHIHEGGSCERGKAPADTDMPYDAFPATGSHYNRENCLHPEHSGDLPPLFGSNGYALMMVFTDRFQPEDVIGRTAVIHTMADDFKTQPAGDSGEKMACGEIKQYEE